MKNLRLKLSIAIALVLCALLALTVGVLAGDEKCTVTYLRDGEVVGTALVDKGSTYALADGEATVGSYFGWFTSQGDFYAKGSSITVNEDITLNLAQGGNVSMLDGLLVNISRGSSYIKLSTNVVYEGSLELADKLIYLDLNGYSLTIKNDSHGLIGGNTGLIVSGGTLAYEFTGENPDFKLYSLLQLLPTTSISNLSFIVKDDATVKSSLGLIEVKNDISGLEGALSLKAYGSIESDRLLRTFGIKGATVDFYEGSSYTTQCEYFFEDFGTYNSSTLTTLTIYGGTFNLDTTLGYAKNQDLNIAILIPNSKPLFSEDISFFFKGGNYSFKKVTGGYEFDKCNHDGPVAIKPEVSSCTEPVTVTHKCLYCQQNYTVQLDNGIGHSYSISLSQDLINNEEVTQPGCYTYHCVSCGYEKNEYFYPSPKDVYVSVGIINSKGEPEVVRVHTSYLFTFDEQNPSRLISFSTAYLEDVLKVTQENIKSIEIPLGTKSVYGENRNGANIGAFNRVSSVEEIILPVSMESVENYAFSEMPHLKTIKGLEYITGNIGTKAFYQHPGSPLDLGHVVFNASKIGEYSFANANMTSITFGSGVKTIERGAFQLEAGETKIKEIFVEGYVTALIDPGTGIETGRGPGEVFSSIIRKSYNSTDQQFASLNIVYSGHDNVETIVGVSCDREGSTTNVCKRCNLTVVTGVVERLPHSFADSGHTHIKNSSGVYPDCPYCEETPSTCRERGFYTPVCSVCGAKDEENKTLMAYDVNNHKYAAKEIVYFAPGVTKGYICELDYYTLGQCVCGVIEEDIPGNRIYHKKVGFHTWNTKDTNVLIEANCGQEGQEEQHCDTCGKKKLVGVKPSGRHNYGEVEITNPGTCQTTGLGVRTCLVCGDKRETVIDGQHVVDENTGTVLLAPTVDSKGQMRYFCTICAAEIVREIPRLEDTSDDSLPPLVIVLIVIGSVLLLAGVGLTVYFTFFKKKNAAKGYKYKFNTLGK